MDLSKLYDSPTSAKPAPAKLDQSNSVQQSTRWDSLTEGEQYARFYNRPLKAGESIAWRSAISGALADGLISQAQSDAQEVKVLGALKKAGLPDQLSETIIKTAIGKPPADDETREKWQRESFRRIQQEHGERRVELLKGIDDLLAKNPEVKRLLHSTGAVFEPRVASALAEHVRRMTNERKLRETMAAKAAKER